MRRKTPITPELQALLDEKNAAYRATKMSDLAPRERARGRKRQDAFLARCLTFAAKAKEWAKENDVDEARVDALLKALDDMTYVHKQALAAMNTTVGEIEDLSSAAEEAWTKAAHYFRMRMDGEE